MLNTAPNQLVVTDFFYFWNNIKNVFHQFEFVYGPCERKIHWEHIAILIHQVIPKSYKPGRVIVSMNTKGRIGMTGHCKE